jgi:UDP-N-acetyl-2-amino-2-deoxyglucuronate dehydrogenase
MNQAIHTVDLLVWFLGEPVEVFAWTGRRLAYFHAAQACDTGPDVGAGSPGIQADQLPRLDSTFRPKVAGLDLASHTAQYEDFVNAVANDHPPLVTVAKATRTLAVVTAIYQSARAGRPVTVPRPTDR